MSAQPESAPRVSKGLLYTLGGVVAAALIGVFVILPLTSGEETLEQPVAVTGTETPGTVEPTPEPGLEGSELPPVGETFEVFSARDPFQQLVNDSEAAAPVVGDETVDGATPVPVTGDPVAAALPDTTTEDGTTVEVEDVFTDGDVENVLLTANGTAYTLEEGDTFGSDWSVKAIDEPCVTLLYGDQARLVCEGQSVHK